VRRVPTSTSGLHPDPLEWLARLTRALRAEGLECALTETVGAAGAIGQLDVNDPIDLFNGLKAVFLADASQAEAFDRCFWRLWYGDEERLQPKPVHPQAPGQNPGPADGGPGSGPGRQATDAVPGSGPPDRGHEAAAPDRPHVRLGVTYSPVEAIAQRSFGGVNEAELREFDHWLDRLMVRLAARRSRRLEPGRRRGVIDVRRSLKDAPRHDGELIRLARRRRRIDRPRVVLLCDVSGSMERYSRFLVRFLLASGRVRDMETFAFSTRLTRLTTWLSRARVDDALETLRTRDWSSGTRIGESLTAFVTGHGRTMLGQRTVVIILSDGLDQGEVEPLVRAMRAIHRKARKVIWLNPLLESSRYAPEARGMRAALPYVDEFASGHSLEALARLPELIRL
jgi:uncharacterized protein with von Willebrand factor type A (vWA) domain